MKVIFDNYAKVSPLKEATPYRGNSNGIRFNTADDSTCIRPIYLAQNVDRRTAENPVTMKCNDVKTNSDCAVSTDVSIRQRSKDSTYCGSCRNILIVYLYCQHSDVLLLAHRWVPWYQPHSISSKKVSS